MDNLWCLVMDEDGKNIIVRQTVFSSWAKNAVDGPVTHGLVRVPTGGCSYKLEIYPINRIVFPCDEKGVIYRENP